jgi:Photosynthesis system II assembly factor YCF48
MRNDGEKRTEMERLPPIARAHLQRPPDSDHLDADLLTSFAEQSLPPHEREQVLEHLSRCAQCREVAVLAGAEPEDAEESRRERESELVTGTAATAAPAPSQVSAARAEPLSPARNRWLGHPPARWIAVAACAVLCATVAVRYPALWRGQHSEVASKIVRPDQIADNSPLNGRSREQLLPVQPAPPPAQHQAAKVSESKSPTMTRSGATGTTQATTLAPPAPLAAPGLRTFSSSTRLAKKAAAAPGASRPQPQLAPQTATAPAGDTGALMSPPGTAQGVAGGVLGGVIGGSTVTAARSGGSDAGFAPHAAARASSQAVAVAAAKAIQPQWSLSEDGIPQRSDDSGHTWRKISVGADLQFRALYADQLEIWVGGAAGILYHSLDMGANWMRVHPTDGDAKLSADIARIDFKDRLHGDVTTTKGEIWTTPDGGVSWVRH